MKKPLILLALLSSLALAASSLEDSSKELATKLSTKLKGKTVVVLDLRDQQKNIRELGRVWADQYLRVDLSDLGVKTITRNQLDALLRELKLTQTGLTEAVSSGRPINLKVADTIITGSISQIGEKYTVSVEALTAQTGETIETGRSDFPKTASVQALWDSLLEKPDTQVGTPTNNSSSVQEPPEQLPTVEVGGYRLQLEKCVRTDSNTVSCTHIVTNLVKDDQRVCFDIQDGTKVVNSDGTIIPATSIRILPSGGNETTLFQDIPIRVIVAFKLNSATLKLPLLDFFVSNLYCNPNVNMRLRDVPIK